MSFDIVLQESWDVMLPLRGQGEPRSMSMLDFAIAEGPLDLMQYRLPDVMVWQGPILAEPERKPKPVLIVAEPQLVTPKIQNKLNRAAPSSEDCADRQRTLGNWCAIFEAMGDAFKAVRQCGGTITRESISVFFASSATGTKANRASSWNLYLGYTRENGLSPAHTDEEAAFAYLQRLKDT